eukprot:TRINITY_DN76024_c0_g1_i1.p1 TRINITY_DN76024_c0_g1~~TRINITY_DN76024_c0_g1_i1.p1  ORF type:complete len:250 (-),score=24.52 TRINITY_DN76024_c0_g1_i1:128-835(-)
MDLSTSDVAACGTENVHSDPGKSDSESEASRDSLQSLLERGNCYEARAWDSEAYRFAQWWNKVSATRIVERQDSQSRIWAAREGYRRYAIVRARSRVARALQEPFVARLIVKQDLLSLRLLFDEGAAYGGTTYHLTAALAERILTFLGYRAKRVVQMKTRSDCIDGSRMCPLFHHRVSRVECRQHVAFVLEGDTSSTCSSSNSDDEAETSDDASIVSSGSLTVARDRLKSYFSCH